MSSCIGPVLDEHKVPAIITDGIDPAILNHEYVFPVGTTHYRYTRLGLLWAKERMGASTAIAVTHSDGTFDSVVSGAREVMGDGLLGVERIAYDEGNMAPLVQRMASKNPDAIYFYVNPDRVIIILQEMERQGFKPSKGIIGGASLFLNLVPESVGGFAEGMVANSWVAVVGSPGPGIKEMQAAVDRYEPGAAIDTYSGGGYAAFRLFHNVVKSLGREVTRERLVEAMYSLRNYDNAQLEPPLTFTREDREANRGVQWVQVKDGKFQYIHDWTLDK
jgi:ABC-type branched-subunit amino acid transport system substrate-binding protein